MSTSGPLTLRDCERIPARLPGPAKGDALGRDLAELVETNGSGVAESRRRSFSSGDSK